MSVLEARDVPVRRFPSRKASFQAGGLILKMVNNSMRSASCNVSGIRDVKIISLPSSRREVPAES